MVAASDIQRAIIKARLSSGNRLIVPNCFAPFGWESDVVSITKAGFAHDYEVKVSRSDFAREFGDNGSKQYRHSVLNGARKPEGNLARPNYFWFATPQGMVGEHEVPDYAGLVFFCDRRLQVVRSAPRLHDGKLDMAAYVRLCNAMSARLTAAWTPPKESTNEPE